LDLDAKMQKRDFLNKTKQFRAMVSINDLYRKSHMGFSKNPLRDPYNSTWRRSAILDLDAKMQKNAIFWKTTQFRAVMSIDEL